MSDDQKLTQAEIEERVADAVENIKAGRPKPKGGGLIDPESWPDWERVKPQVAHTEDEDVYSVVAYHPEHGIMALSGLHRNQGKDIGKMGPFVHVSDPF